MGEFIRITKDNPNRDRGLIAVDAICSVVENQEAKNVSIMTMDGFWYDVLDSLEDLYGSLMDNSPGQKREETANAKKDYYRTKKMMSPSAGTDRTPAKHDSIVMPIKREAKDTDDVFSPSFRKKKRDFAVSRNLPSSEGEGRCNLTPEQPHSPPAGGELKGL